MASKVFSAHFCTFVALAKLQALAGQADLSVSSVFSTNTVTTGELIVVQATITNFGPGAATGVRLTNSVSPNVSVFAVTLSEGTILSSNSTTIVCDLGTVPTSNGAVVSLTLMPLGLGTLVSTSTVSANELDSNRTNNSAVSIALAVPLQFYPGPNLKVARAYPTATLLPDGRVLIVGGTGAGAMASAEIYNPQTKTFSLTGSLHTGRDGHAATLLQDGMVLITGGYTVGSLVTAELYDPTKGTFTMVSNMHNVHIEHTATLLQDGRVLVEGNSYSYPANAAEIYVPSLHAFTNINGTLYGGSSRMAFRLANGNVILPGGTWWWDFDPLINSEYYDPALNQFVALSPLHYPRTSYGGVQLLDGRIVIAGGNGSGQTAELLNTNSLSFVAASNTMRTMHWFATANRLPDGKVLVAGWSAQPDLFDPATDGFSRTVDMLTARQYFTATTLQDGTVLVVGGTPSGTPPGGPYLASTEIYDPARTKPPPAVSIANASAVEGNSGTTNCSFGLTLSSPMGVPVSVDYATASGSATDGEDFLGANGTLVFPPGVTKLTLPVAILGDSNYEPDETFTVTLLSVTNAVIDAASSTATGTILNDDDFPTVSVAPASVVEGNVRTTNIAFNIFLSANSYLPGYVSYATADDTALAGSDYIATNGLMVFQPGVTNLMVTVVVKGDTLVEPDETFLVTLSSPTNLLVGSAGIGTILADDGLPGLVDHFVFKTNEALQFAAWPLGITITANDAYNNVVTNFSGPVALSGSMANVPGYKFEFEEADFSIWTPLNAGPNPGPYIFKLLDLSGVGVPSMALGLIPNPDPADGISRSIPLQAGVPYFISMAIARADEGGYAYGPDTTVHLQVNGVELNSYFFGTTIYSGQLQRTNLSATFTPPTNGLYSVSILIDRGFGENGDIKSYVDDIKIAFPRLTPDWTGTFTNGVWSGPMLTSRPATNYILHAEDYNGHVGDSPPFTVLNNADLGVQASVAPPVPRVGSDVVLTFTITNAGIGTASSVLLTNILSGDVTVRSVGANQGACNNIGNVVSCSLGTLTNHQSVTVTQIIRSSSIGFVTNAALLTSSLIDPDLSNNSLLKIIAINPPLVFSANTSILEGDTGSANALVQLWLSGASSQNVSIDYATANGTAVAGSDYTAVSGTVMFPPGVSTQIVAVPILGDLLNEANETLTLQLSNPTNAALGQNAATITILDNDPLPSLSISDSRVVEGDSGTTQAVFVVTLSAPSGRTINLNWPTTDATATSSNDYVAVTSGFLSFASGVMSNTLSVNVRGDTVNEPDETFFVILTNVPNGTLATFARSTGICTIINDDLVKGRLDHFTWSPLELLQIAGQPIPVTVTACDAFNAPVTNYVGSVPLSATALTGRVATAVSPISIFGFTNGAWNGSILLNNLDNHVVVTADDGQQHVGQTKPFNVVANFPLVLTGPAGANEGDGILIGAGRLTVAVPRFSDVSFALASSNTNQVLAPLSALLPAGQTSVVFDITFPDDRILDGPHTNSISASATNYATSVASVIVHDPMDTNGDGLPDWWMMLYFEHLLGDANDNSRPEDSAAGDGVTNLQKYRTGKNPLIWDNLHFVDFGMTLNSSFKLTIFGQLGSNYTLQGTTDLVSWRSLFMFNCTNRTMDLFDSNAVNQPTRLYRLVPASAH